MICEKCKGSGMIKEYDAVIGDTRHIKLIPCPDCMGGIAHCCDGIQEQPEKIMEDALLGIAYMDVYTREGEKPAHEVMRGIAKEALKKLEEKK